MEPTILILIAAVLIILLAVVFIKIRLLNKEKKPKEPNYKALFNIGLIFLAVYFAMLVVKGLKGYGDQSSVFFILGLVYTIMGLAHRKRWGKPRRELTDKEIESRKKLMITLVALVVLVVIFFLLGSYYKGCPLCGS